MRGLRKSITVLLIIMMIITIMPVNATHAEKSANPETSTEQGINEIIQIQQVDLETDQLKDEQPALEEEQTTEITEKSSEGKTDKSELKTEDLEKETEEGNDISKQKPQLLVKYKDLDKAEEILATTNSQLDSKHPKKPDKKLKLKHKHENLNLCEIIVDSDISLKKAKAELEKNPEVEYVQPNYLLQFMEAPTEPAINQQWALGTAGETAYNLNIGDRWTDISSMASVNVAIIDTGIDTSHSELASQILSGWDFYNDDNSVYDTGEAAHGTQIAGIISADINGEGIAGLATNARFMPLKFMENGNGYTSDAIAAINYAKEHGIKIINCSWGTTEYNQALKDAIENNPDILFICAAGNSGDTTKFYPAAYNLPNVIAVASMNQDGDLASSSCYGSHVQIAAPGENILSTSPGNSYANGSGTSMAAAYVTAAAAIYIGLNPEATTAEIASALKENAVARDSLTNIISCGALEISPLLDGLTTETPGTTEEDYSGLPQEVIDLLNTVEKYSDLSDEQKELLYFHLNLTDAVLQACEDAGLTLKQSIYKAKIMQSLEFTLTDADAACTAFQSEKTAAEQAELLADYLARFTSLTEGKEQILDLFKQGFPARNIINAYIVSKALELALADIIDNGQSTADLSAYSPEEQQLIQALAGSYNVKADAIATYMQENQKTVQEIDELIQAKQTELNITFDEKAAALETDDDDAIEPYPNAPFGYRAGVNETVNLNSGSLTYKETLATIPGANGLDLNLTMVYNSAESYKGNDLKVKYPQKYLGRGWALSFTRILYREDGTYVRLEDGSTYHLIYENEEYKLDEYELEDIQVAASSFKVTSLTYADGKKETFDTTGHITAITDRFGNKITFTNKTIGNTQNKEVIIIDSAGQKTRILWNCELAANLYNIILPDKSVIALYLDSSGNLVKKVDQENRVTTYAYESVTGSQGNSYRNLTSVTYPTGLVANYEFQSATASSVTYYRIKNMNKKDGKKLYLNDSYSYSASFINADSDYTTTLTDAAGIQSAYTFDNEKDLKISETVTENDKTRTKVEYKYTDTELPEKITTTIYGAESSIGKIAIEQYTYDEKGNVLTYTNPMAQGAANTEYQVKYSYDSSYNLQETVEYKKDAGTTVKQINDLTPDRKAVRETRITENGVIKKKTGYEYDACGNIVSLNNYTDLFEAIPTTFTYTNGAWIKTKTTGESTAQYSYDSMGRLISSIDPNGNTSRYEYDSLGRTTRVVFPDSSSREYTYNDSDNSIIYKNENNNGTLYDFDVFGNIKSVTDQTTHSRIASFDYDDLLRLSESTDGNGNQTAYTYDYAGRVLSKTIGGSYIENYEYNDGYSHNLSRVVKTVEGQKNAPTIQTFQDQDLQNNVVKSGYLNQQIEYATTYEYDYLGNKTKELTAKDEKSGYDYTAKYETDYAGNMLSATIDKSIKTQYQYDLLGRLISSTDPKGNTTNYTYNDQNKLIEQVIPFTDQDSTVNNYDYDPNGNLIKQKVSSGSPEGTSQYRETEFEYNAKNMLLKVIGNDGEQECYTQYTYDAVGNLTSQATGNGANISRYEYNSLNQITKKTDPMGNSETYDYDLNNNLTRKVDRNQNRMEITYNPLNQPLAMTVIQPDGAVQSQFFSYAVNGAVIKKENENMSSNLSYDNQGRLIGVEDSSGIKQSYTYDLAGNRVAYQLKQNGQTMIVLNYTYDKLNHLTGVNEGSALRASYAYDPNGNCISQEYDNGIQTNYQYNNANLITQMVNKHGSDTLSSYAYTYYLDGNVKTKADHQSRGTSYEYDGLGRLSKENENDTVTLYTYDLASNRKKMIKPGTGTTTIETNYDYDANDRLIWEETQQADNTWATTQYFYDANGNQISRLYNQVTEQTEEAADVSLETRANTQTYECWEYDGFNRVTSYMNPTVTAEYAYNADGLRISKTVNNQLTKHVWDGSNMVMEMNSHDDPIDLYIRGNRLIKSDDNGYYLYNAHGDVIQLTNQQGAVTKDYLYDAFGVEKGEEAGDTNPFRYCGEYMDRESGCVYLRARYYDPSIGRFISEDSFAGDITNPLSLNLSIFCYNNPINYWDPSGHWSIEGVIDTVKSWISSGSSVSGGGGSGSGGGGYGGKSESGSDWGNSGTGNPLVTAAQLKEFGWCDTSDEFVKKLNDSLIKYGITDKESIALFMATMAAESDWGRTALEEGSDSYFAGKSYGKNRRGAGYIQITSKDTHLAFLKTMNDSFSGEDTASYIAKNYAMEASAWYWSKMQKTGEGNLNAYVTKNGGSLGIFLITQYYVNGVPKGIGDDLTSIRKGGSFTINNNSLSVNGHSYSLPVGWDKRQDAYNKAMGAFK